jgi:hypothetical protein
MLYDTTKDTTTPRTVKVFFFLIFIAIVVMFFIWIKPFDRPVINTEQFVTDCETKMIEHDAQYALCCADKNGRMKECSDHSLFERGQFITVVASLQKLAIYDKYHACIILTHLDSNITYGQIFDDKEVYCTKLNYKKYYNYLFNDGFINTTGEFTILNIYMFPELNYSKNMDYYTNLDKGTLVLNITGIAIG